MLRSSLLVLSLFVTPLTCQAISASGQVAQAITSTTFDSCTQTTSSFSIPVGPLPTPATLPGISYSLGSSSISLSAGGTAFICNFSSPAGSFSRDGTVDVTLTAPFETTVAVQVVGTYGTSGASGNTTVSGAVSGYLGGFFSPVTSINQTSQVQVGPQGTTFRIAHSCSGSGFSGFASTQTNLTVSWSVVDAASTAPYGNGCLNGPTTQTPTSTPHLGGSMAATVTGVAGPVPIGFVAVGLSDRTSSYGSLPLSLHFAGMTFCILLQSAEIIQPIAPASASSLAFQLPLPSAPVLVGVNLFSQVFSYAPGINPLDTTVTGGVRWQLGT